MSKSFLLLLTLLAFSLGGYCQTATADLIALAKVYRNFHFSNDPPKEALEKLNAIASPELARAKALITEAIHRNNKIATTPYLTRPDSLTLTYLFTIRSINWNMYEADPKDNGKLVDSLTKFPPSEYEKLACYYGFIFISIGNKNTPLDMADVNFDLERYGLRDDTEKGIFFLKGMETFGSMIWGYMNVVKPPNYEMALSVINTFPKFNGQPYYQFQDLNFQDFLLTTDKRKPKQSFKKQFINGYLNTLYYHSACLGQKKKTKKEQQDVMLGSIMHIESYYKYSDHPEIFQRIFKKIKE